MEILVKLTDDEQKLLLRHAGYYPDNGPWKSIADKIRRTQQDELWGHDPETEQGTTFEMPS